MNQSGAQIGAANYQQLQAYFETLAREGRPVPIGKNGMPNLSAIALACGFDRQVLYNNPRCKQLIDEKVKELGVSDTGTKPTPKPNYDPKERRIRELEKQLADAREQLADLRRYKQLFEHAQETGRDIIP